VAHFGLGDVTEIDSLEIRWPRGGRQVSQDVPVNRIVRVVEGTELALVPDSAAGGADARETVLRFWESYRSATRHRIEGRTRDAALEYARALELRPDHWDAWYYLGNVSFELHDFDGARRAWERLVQLNPGSARGHTQLGVLHACFEQDQFDLDEAEARFQRALDLNKEETGPPLWLGKTALIRGDLAGAREYLQMVLGSNATSPEAHFLSGYIAWKEGRTADAEARLSTALLHAAPAEGADQELLEGGTRSGRAMLASGSPCHPIGTLVRASLRPMSDDSDVAERMTGAYTDLERLLGEAQGR
jgi:tetratricopeptide (TPR) repeat protein